jgi:hypothetical protein
VAYCTLIALSTRTQKRLYLAMLPRLALDIFSDDSAFATGLSYDRIYSLARAGQMRASHCREAWSLTYVVQYKGNIIWMVLARTTLRAVEVPHLVLRPCHVSTRI